LALVIASIVPATVLGFRSAILLPLLQAALILNYTHRRFSTLQVLGMASIIVVAFTVYGVQREISPAAGTASESTLSMMAERPDLAFAIVARSRGADVVANVIDRLAVTGAYDS